MAVPDLTTRFLIIGGGIAGVSAAEAIRILDPNADITIISDEHNFPYFRMSLTRYLAGEVALQKLDLHDQAWYQANQIELLTDLQVEEILPEQKLVVLSDQRKIAYEKLILANGASPFVPPIPGHELQGVMTLRSLEDAQTILRTCEKPINIVCIGGGLLGLEIAGAISRHGAKVTVLEALDWLLPRQLGKEAALILQKEIEKLGVRVIVPAKVKQITGSGSVKAVELDDSSLIPADLVLISAGVRPNLGLAKKAGLEVNRGIVVDQHMRTSRANIFAAGDVCEFEGICYGLWIPAKKQGEVAGRNAFGDPAVFKADAPSTKLKVLGIDLFSIGQFSPSQEGDRLVTWQSEEKYASLLLRNEVIVGANLIGKTGLDLKVKKAVELGQSFQNFKNEVDLSFKE
jgi:nitrite reductase (NADH) large subunit